MIRANFDPVDCSLNDPFHTWLERACRAGPPRPLIARSGGGGGSGRARRPRSSTPKRRSSSFFRPGTASWRREREQELLTAQRRAERAAARKRIPTAERKRQIARASRARADVRQIRTTGRTVSQQRRAKQQHGALWSKFEALWYERFPKSAEYPGTIETLLRLRNYRDNDLRKLMALSPEDWWALASWGNSAGKSADRTGYEFLYQKDIFLMTNDQEMYSGINPFHYHTSRTDAGVDV
jgi:hypothetical protein